MELLNYDKSILGSNGLAVGDFWRWAYSDILSNRNRAIFGEFLVASALGVIHQPRTEWDAVDIIYDGIKIEVKTSAYLQSWKQDKPSLIKFDIAKKKSWYADTNTYSDTPDRPSDYYVFCLFTERDEKKADVLNLSQWHFYILPTQLINDKFGEQKSISLRKIEREISPVAFHDIKAIIS